MLGRLFAVQGVSRGFLQHKKSFSSQAVKPHKKSFSSQAGSASPTQRPSLTLLGVAGIISLSSVAVSPVVLTGDQHEFTFDSDKRPRGRASEDIFTANTSRVHFFTRHEVADEVRQLQDEIQSLVVKHGEQRIQRQLTRRLEAQANMSGEPEETISFGEVDPKLLSSDTVQGLIEAFHQGARFDDASLEKLYQLIATRCNS